jgi:hypothetical protein
VIVVGVRDDDMRQRAVADRAQDRRKVCSIHRPRIDQHDFAALADDIGVGALVGERARIVGDDAHDPRRQFLRFAVDELDLFAEWRLFGHVGCPLAAGNRAVIADPGLACHPVKSR